MRLLLGALVVVCASGLQFGCGDDEPVGASGGAGGVAGSGGTGGTSGSAGGGSGGTGGVIEPTLTPELYPKQPMVVDVNVALPDGIEARLELDAASADPGVHIASLPESDSEARTYRLRGLEPDTDYSADLVVGTDRFAVSFKTPAALPGYKSSFSVTTNGTPAPDYRMFDYSEAPVVGNAGVYLIDPLGKTRWFLAYPDAEALDDLPGGIKLLPDGNILFILGDRMQIIDELGTVQSEVNVSQLGVPLFHHDIIALPNGNFLAISIETREINYPADNQDHYVVGDFLVEFSPQGIITWSWSALDHLDPQRKRADFDNPFYPIFSPTTGEQAKDWSHGNGVIYDATDDSLIFSMRHQDWIIKIDHKTGDIVWKLGDEGDFTLNGDRWFFHQHSPELQPDGSLVLFDNGVGDPYQNESLWNTRPMRIALDTQTMEASIAWVDDQETYLSLIAGDIDRLSNDSFLILDSTVTESTSMPFPSHSRIREVDPTTGQWVWVLDGNEGDFSYRCIPSLRLPGEAE
ncbi:MAG: aryl-sulfate sulfotransferase [Polyangiaceae bacterium]|nr:aryl-sulfate sulfotransferase [Myxococcales bacterium]MCB9587503.1 aryl-sulfate sulfotransferase [Polyangiaceae bacterium]MCB9605700.1 aryl-sulfate sulfotransferase [Polyangiaceae bacterium]